MSHSLCFNLWNEHTFIILSTFNSFTFESLALIKSHIRHFDSQTRGAWQASMNDRQHDFAFRGENFHFAMIVVYISLCVLKLKIDACVWGIGLIVTRVPWHGRLSTKDTIESKCICILVKFVSTKTASRFSPLSSI